MKLRFAAVLVLPLGLVAAACFGGEPAAPVEVSPVATATRAPGRASPQPPPSPGASPSPGATAVVRTPTPLTTAGAGTPVATPDVSGRAITVADLQQAWAVRGIGFRTTPNAPTPSGFSVPPSPVTLTRGAQSVDLWVIIYPSQAAAAEDFVLGPQPSLRSGRSLGSYDAIWWNENVVVVLRQRAGEITNDARDAFLSLGGPLPPTPVPRTPTPAASPVPPSPTAAGATATPATATASPGVPRTPSAAAPSPAAPTATPAPATPALTPTPTVPAATPTPRSVGMPTPPVPR